MSGLFDVSFDGAGREIYRPAPGAVPPAVDMDTPETLPTDDQDDELFMGEPDPESGITLRPYQRRAIEKIEAELYGVPADEQFAGIEAKRSTLLVQATGTGKTVVVGQVIRRRKAGRVMVLAHRKELIDQAKTTIEAVTGEHAEVEMADQYADASSPIVVATVQTLISGNNGNRRMNKFVPDEFSLIVTDEGHHSTAVSYGAIYAHFHANPNLKHLGVTATPDRADEEALGQVYESVADTYEISDAIHDGWLVPIVAIPVFIEGLDYSTVRTTAGDLNGADLAAVLEAEEPLHQMLQAIVEIACGVEPGTIKAALALGDDGFRKYMADFAKAHPPRKSLIFAASVKHAEMLCEILNRWLPGRATWVCGKTPREERKEKFADYRHGRYAFLVNVGVCSEGWDCPSVELVVMARPTKSRAVYCQAAGRGTRALPGVVDGPETPEARKAAIAASKKTHLEIIDFVGNVGRHTLMTPADILGGNYSEEEIALANRNAEKKDRQGADMEEELEKARREIEAKAAREAARRAKVRVASKYVVGGRLDPFSLFHVVPQRERGWEKGKKITDKMKAALERQKLWRDDITYTEARQFIQGMAERRKKDLCTYRQASVLAKAGLPIDVSFDQAHAWIDRLAANHWQVPADLKAQIGEKRAG